MYLLPNIHQKLMISFSFRASAIRALCCITKDPLMLQCCERYMKQALVDRNSNVASAALVSSIKQAQLSQGN